MKKQLPTGAIANELAESSIFFHSPSPEQSNGGVSVRPNTRTVEHPGASSIGQTTERADDRPPDRPTERLATSWQEPEENYSTERPRDRVAAQVNDRTSRREEPRPKAERYSFEIYPSQKEQIEEYVYLYKRRTGKRLSASQFIRDAIDYYFQTLNRHEANR